MNLNYYFKSLFIGKLDIMKEKYLRINSATEKVNKQLDDTSEINLERIHLMGMDWWSEFGDSAIKFVNN